MRKLEIIEGDPSGTIRINIVGFEYIYDIKGSLDRAWDTLKAEIDQRRQISSETTQSIDGTWEFPDNGPDSSH